MQIAILGAGMVGRAIALDLSKDYDVTSFDINQDALERLAAKDPAVKTIKYDLRNYNAYPSLLRQSDLVISAVPGFMGYQTLKTVIECGKNIVDISFFPEHALDLDLQAKKKGVTAIVDCGVAPGMSNFILGHCDTLMKITDFECMVGGLPKKRLKPFEYKAPFSPADVIEEYIRPARYVENGHIITKPALSDAELIDFEFAGTLESFNTDGLRSILYTMPHIKNMKEKTLRYPGHIDLINALLKAGFFNTKEVNVKGNMIRPIDLTSAILFHQWKLAEDDEEFTLMKIIIKGIKDEKHASIEYLLYDEYDEVTKMASMSRTTGYACTAAVNLIIKNLFTEKGVFPPELIGSQKKCFDFVMNYLKERNVNYRETHSIA